MIAIMRDYQQCICACHRRQKARPLRPCEQCYERITIRLDHRAEKMRQRCGSRDLLPQLHLDGSPEELGMAEHFPNCGPCEQLERHERRYGIARKTEPRHSREHAKSHWRTWTN